MTALGLFVVALALAADSFAAALGRGAVLAAPPPGAALAAGAAFGGFQFAMPLAGALLGAGVGHWVEPVDHWIAFAILAGIGLHMALPPRGDRRGPRLPATAGLLLVAFATSVDALAAGFGAAVVDLPVWPLAVAAGLVTFALSALGIRLGATLGGAWGRRAEIAGGLMLAAVGTAILVDHLSV